MTTDARTYATWLPGGDDDQPTHVLGSIESKTDTKRRPSRDRDRTPAFDRTALPRRKTSDERWTVERPSLLATLGHCVLATAYGQPGATGDVGRRIGVDQSEGAGKCDRPAKPAPRPPELGVKPTPLAKKKRGETPPYSLSSHPGLASRSCPLPKEHELT